MDQLEGRRVPGHEEPRMAGRGLEAWSGKPCRDFKQANDMFGFYFDKDHAGCSVENVSKLGGKTGSWET